MIEIDPASPVPLYLQIADEMRRLIAMGALKPGDKAPTVREIAVTTRVNRNTAARAIQHLEAEGVVRTRVGQGTFVEPGVPIDRVESQRAIDEAIDRLLVHAQALGVRLGELDGRVSERIEAFRRRQTDGNNDGGERKDA